MFKITLILVFVTAAVNIQAAPMSLEDIIEASKSRNWEQVQQLLNSNFASDVAWKPISFASVRDLKPSADGHVYGQAEYAFQSSSNINGHTSEETGGHKIINDDGKVQEFDFKP